MRSWTAQNASYDFSILTWNILADQLWVNLPECDDAFLTWEYREPLILKEILKQRPDVICLQELDMYEESLQPKLSSLGYHNVYQRKPGWHRDGTAIFYDSQKFQYEKHEILWYDDENQFALSVTLRYGTMQFVVVSTHLKAHADQVAVRQQQVHQLWNFVRKFDAPVIVAGDFNGGEKEPFYDQMRETAFQSAYEGGDTTLYVRQEGELRRERKDYIFYNEKLIVRSTLSLPQLEKPIPNQDYPSDHILLAARFSFINNKLWSKQYSKLQYAVRKMAFSLKTICSFCFRDSKPASQLDIPQSTIKTRSPELLLESNDSSDTYQITTKGMKNSQREGNDGWVYAGSMIKDTNDNYVNDIIMENNPNTGHKHFVIKYDQPTTSFTLQDIQGNDSGTFVKITSTLLISGECIISYGDQFCVCEESNGILKLKLINRQGVETLYSFNSAQKQRVILGRLKECDVQLEDTSLSRYQSEFSYDNGWHMNDGLEGKCSTNGTWMLVTTPFKITNGLVFKAGMSVFTAKVIS